MNIKDIVIKRVNEGKKETIKKTYDLEVEQIEKFKENCAAIGKHQVDIISALVAEFNDSCEKKKKA